MISYVRGELTAVEKDKVIVDVGGVGYGVFMPEASMGMLPQMGEEIKLHTYLNVREDAMQLFGFLTRDDSGSFSSPDRCQRDRTERRIEYFIQADGGRSPICSTFRRCKSNLFRTGIGKDCGKSDH